MNRPFRKIVCLFVTAAFLLSNLVLPTGVSAQTLFNLPVLGTTVSLTPSFRPLTLSGLNLYPDNPFKFDFLVDQGDTTLKDEDLRRETNRLIKYFLAALTVPESELWVNLSPYEKNRIVPDKFGKTEMGRDLLAQDYMLKQLTASLMNPEGELGRKFWEKIQALAKEKSGGEELPKDMFHKIWIVPDKAVIYVHAKGAFIVKSHLKVLMEEDYLALRESGNREQLTVDSVLEKSAVSEKSTVNRTPYTKVLKEILLPVI